MTLFFFSRLVKFHYAKPTISFNMHVSREPQDDGYTVLPAQEGRVPERSLSEKSLTLESSSDLPKRMRSPKQVRENQVLVLKVNFYDRDHEYLKLAFIYNLLI